MGEASHPGPARSRDEDEGLDNLEFALTMIDSDHEPLGDASRGPTRRPRSTIEHHPSTFDSARLIPGRVVRRPKPTWPDSVDKFLPDPSMGTPSMLVSCANPDVDFRRHAGSAPRKRLRNRMGKESQATTVVGVESSEPTCHSFTALRKPTGGVRALLPETFFEDWCHAQSFSSSVMFAKHAISPIQYALSTRAGCECIAHAWQALCEQDPNATILSVDGIGAFDRVSRGAMLQGLPIRAPIFWTPSRYLWVDDERMTHNIDQGEGGEQGDPMMPLLFSLGQHAALLAVQRQFFCVPG